MNLLPQKQMLPSKAGETNQYSVIGRGLVVSLTQDPNEAIDGCLKSIASGNAFLQINRVAAIPRLAELSDHLSKLAGTSNLVQQMNDRDLNFISADGLNNIGAIFTSSEDPNITEISRHIAQGNGPLLPILTSLDGVERFVHEKTITYNIAAAGGDVSLLNA
jgi:delta 1-pyrroline-5-carboxylate dehydrogenase